MSRWKYVWAFCGAACVGALGAFPFAASAAYRNHQWGDNILDDSWLPRHTITHIGVHYDDVHRISLKTGSTGNVGAQACNSNYSTGVESCGPYGYAPTTAPTGATYGSFTVDKSAVGGFGFPFMRWKRLGPEASVSQAKMVAYYVDNW